MLGILRSPRAHRRTVEDSQRAKKFEAPHRQQPISPLRRRSRRSGARRLCILTFVAVVAIAEAQQPDTLKLAIPAPATGVQIEAALGSSVALDGGFTAAGAPNDDTGGQDSGVVKIFDSASASLLYILTSPLPSSVDQYGWSVEI